MRSKPMRKNAHKERLFTLEQNKTDFDYLKECGRKTMPHRKKNVDTRSMAGY